MREKRQRKDRQRGSRGWRVERKCVCVCVAGGTPSVCVWLRNRNTERVHFVMLCF